VSTVEAAAHVHNHSCRLPCTAPAALTKAPTPLISPQTTQGFATMARTRGQQVEEAEAAGHSMTLPDELLLRVLEHAMVGRRAGVSRRWRALHDGACTRLHLRNGMTDDGMHALCARLPAHTRLGLVEVTSLTTDRYMKATDSLSGRDTLTKPATQQQQQQQQHHQQRTTSGSSNSYSAAATATQRRQQLPLDGGGTACGGWADYVDLPQPQQLLRRDGRGATRAAPPPSQWLTTHGLLLHARDANDRSLTIMAAPQALH